MIRQNLVAIQERPGMEYFPHAPFHPSERYPEYPYGELSELNNSVYEGVRELFRLMKLDEKNFGTRAWNPLAEIIKPGETVTVKPNFVLHFNASGKGLDSLVTHGSVIRPVVDYVVKALDGKGKVIVGDAPHGNADFEEIVRLTGARAVVDFYKRKGVDIALTDFRQYRYGYGEEGFLKETKTRLDGDPLGYTSVNLAEVSELYDLDRLERLYGADYDRSIIRVHHHQGTHEYLIANSVLSAHTVISIPKLKVHSKAGVTINLKNLVGINGDKNWLPHYRIGNPSEGGDEFPKSRLALENGLRSLDRAIVDAVLSRDSMIRKAAYRVFLKFLYPLMGIVTRKSNNPIYRGNWSGNDTVWRMVLDLNKILLYADSNGILHEKPQRKFFSLVDGIVAGEGEGPLGPTPRACGILLGGYSSLLVDLIGAKLIGLNPARVPLFRNAYRDKRYPLAPCPVEAVEVVSNNQSYQMLVGSLEPNLHFTLPRGWQSIQNGAEMHSDPPFSADEVDETTIKSS